MASWVMHTTLSGSTDPAFEEAAFFISTSALISDDARRLLLARRSSSKRFDPLKWETPGGFLEPNESPIDGLKRELREELGVEVVRYRLFDVFQHRDFKLPNLVLVYEVKIAGELQLEPSEIAEVKWFTETEARGLDFASNCGERACEWWRRRLDDNGWRE